MKANVIYSISPSKNKLSDGIVYKAQDSDITYIILKPVSMKDLTFEVLAVDELEKQVCESRQPLPKAVDQTWDRLSEYITKLERENEQLNNEIDALKHMLDRKDND